MLMVIKFLNHLVLLLNELRKNPIFLNYLHGLKNNVLMRPLGNVLYFMPPYVISKKEISFVSDIMKEGVDEATKKNS